MPLSSVRLVNGGRIMVRRRMKTMAVMLSMVFGVALAGGVLLAVFGSSTASAGTTCSIYWTGKTGQTWSTSSNWSLTNGGGAATRTPTATDYVCMSTAPTRKTASLTTSETVGGINWPQTATVSPSLTDSGSLTIGNHTTSYASTIDNLTVSGSLAGTATLTVPPTGTLTLTGGTLSGSHLINQGTATQTGMTNFYAGSTLENAGSLVLADNSTLYDADNNASNLLTNDLGATLTYSSANSSDAIVYVAWSNAGTVDVAGNSTLYSYGTFDNTNSVSVADTSTLYLQQGSSASHSDTGSYNVVAGALLNIAGGTRTIGAGASFTGAGQVAVTGGTADFAVGVPVSNLTLAGGTVTGSPTVADATLTNGTLTGSGTMTLTGNSTLDYPTIDNGYRLLNQGHATAPDTTGNYLDMTNGGVLENAGTYTTTTPYGITADNNSANAVLNDASGTWVVNVPTSSGTTTSIYAPFDNHGMVSIVSGSLVPTSSTPGGADTGTYAISAGAQLDLGSGTRNFSGASQTGSGSFHLNGGTVTGTVTVSNANLDAGTLTGSGTLTVAPSGTATIDHPTIDNGYRVLNQGQATAPDTSGNYLDMTNGGVLENAGIYTTTTPYGITADGNTADQVLNDASGTWVVNVPTSSGTTTSIYAPLTNLGTVQLTKGTLNVPTLTNLTGGILTGGTYVANTGTLEVGADITTNAATITLGATGGITNGGANALAGLNSNSGSLTLEQALTLGQSLTNSGAITVMADTLQATSLTQTAGTLTVAPGATLQANPVRIDAGTLTGSGTVIGQVSGSGTVAPGGPTGTLSVTGAYAPGSAGTLGVSVGASDSSRLSVSGAATLSGALAITTATGFTPTLGTTYTVLSAGSRTGTFAGVSGASLPGGYFYQVTYGPTDVTLTVSQAPQISVNDVGITQQAASSTTATFTVSLNTPSLSPVTVNYATQDGTALAGSDYQGASGTLIFPGDGTTTVQSINVTINPDPSCDPNELFTVVLGSPTNATVTRGTGTGTIVNNAGCATAPGAPTSVTASPGISSATVSFTAPNNGGSPITSYTVTGTDHTTVANGGETGTGSASPITVPHLTNGDSYTFTVTATNAVGTGPASTSSNAVIPTAPPIPTVTSVAPSAGPTAGGQAVTIVGTGLTGATKVVFGTTAATSVTVVSDAKITATSPVHAVGAVAVHVTTPGGTSPTVSGDQYTYDAAPTITKISPTTGLAVGGTVVTVTGTGFVPGSTVKFGAAAATKVTYVSASSLTAKAPVGTGTVDVTAATPGGTSTTVAADRYRYIAAPGVTSVAPNAGPATGGKVVTIGGTGLTGATKVVFGTTAATKVTVVSDTKITATTPVHAVGVVAVHITTPGGTSPTVSADQYTYDATPTITKISPTTGPSIGGTVVTVTGTGFVPGSTVKFGASAAIAATYVSASSLKVTSPAGTGLVNVATTTPGGTSATVTADRYTYQATPPGSALAWGYNNDGELGNGTTTSSTTPGPVSLPGGTVVTAIAAGGGHSLALTSTGSVLAWGNNDYGELGNGTTTSSTTPVAVTLPAGTTVTAIAADDFSSLALTR